ncbi:MAG: MFS transporter [Promethearchaeota archaeon]|nr:MAG: MFS transporter [Candidatus Lokiarchaeota archaeon]
MIIARKSVIFMLLNVFFIYFSIMMLISYLPRFLENMGTGPSIITLTMTIFMSTFFIFPPFLGKYSDKLQNRIYFILLGSAGMLFMLILLIFAKDIIILNIELFILGFFCSSSSIYLTLYSELVQNDKKWISFYNANCAIGWFLGVVIGGLWIDIFSVETIIIFSLMIFLISIIFVIFIRENRQAILNANESLSKNINIEMDNKDDNIPRSLFYSIFFRNFGVIPILNIIIIIMSFHISSNSEVGLLIGLNPLMQFFFMLLMGKVLSEKNLKLFLILGYILTVIVILGYIFSNNFWGFFIFQVLVSLSYAMFWMATIVFLAQNSTPVNKGRFMGYANTSLFAGTTIGGLFFSLLLGIFNSDYYVAMPFMIMFPIISILIMTIKFREN